MVNEGLVTANLASVRAFVLDVDGTLVLADDPNVGSGTRALPGAAAVLQQVRATGRRLVCFTNGTSQLPGAQAARLRAVGLDVRDGEFLNPAVVAAEYIQREHAGASVLAFGNDGLLLPLQQAGVRLTALEDAESCGVVLVGADPEFTYRKLVAACRAVWAGASLLVTSMAPWFASRGGRLPSTSGPIAAGIVHATGATPIVVGKPSSVVMDVISTQLGVEPSEMAVVGDDMDLEIRMGREAGSVTVLVLTGSTTSVAEGLQPDLVVDKIGDLLPLM
jgi:4-nitrophenyl phosphatase